MHTASKTETEPQPGYVSQLQDFCVHDGEGIRTTIFLSGCPLRCQWCANPETWNLTDGRKMRVQQIIDKCLRQRIFYSHSGGGVTISGGEPGLQPQFVSELTSALKENGFDVCMETCGHFHWDEMASTIAKLDMLFFDLKHMDDEAHRKLTRVSNKRIKENLIRAGKCAEDIIVRLPLIPQHNDQKDNLRATAAFMQSHLVNPRIELLPYHNWSHKKYENLGQTFIEFSIPQQDDIQRAKSILQDSGITVVDYK